MSDITRLRALVNRYLPPEAGVEAHAILDRVRDERDGMKTDLEIGSNLLKQALDREESLSKCSTCYGLQHASRILCICGGTGLAADEVQNMREEIVRLNKEAEKYA